VIDLNQMAVFARVVQEESFTAAARALGLPKSTVSERVARLEARLGATLLLRTTRSVRCTEAGRAYHARCLRLLAAANAADAAVMERNASVRGRIRLAVPHLFGYAFLPPALSSFLRAHPETELDVILRDGPVDLAGEGFDVGVQVGKLPGGVVARRLGTASHVLCASPAFLRERGVPRGPRDLTRFDCILYQGLPVVPSAWPLGRGGVVTRVRVRGRLRVGSVLLAREGALAGLGIASLPGFLCAEDLREGRLVRVLEDCRTLQIPISLVFPSRRHVAGRVRALVEALVATFRSVAPWSVEGG